MEKCLCKTPCYEVINTWPEMGKHFIGEIITLPCYDKQANQWFIQEVSDKTYDAYFDRYPHLFLKLECNQEKLGKTTTGVELIAEERQRQIDNEGYTPEHDDTHTNGELAMAAACYAIPEDRRKYKKKWKMLCERVPKKWPFDGFWKPSPDNRIKELAKSGALVAAEIDRLKSLKIR